MDDGLVVGPQNPLLADLDRQRKMVTSSILQGLFSNPAIDRIVSGESQGYIPWTPQALAAQAEHPGYVGQGDTTTRDMIVGGLLAPFNFLGGGEGALAHVGAGGAGMLAHMLPGPMKKTVPAISDTAEAIAKIAKAMQEQTTQTVSEKFAPKALQKTEQGQSIKAENQGWAGWNSPEEAAKDIGYMLQIGASKAFKDVQQHMPNEFWNKVYPLLVDQYGGSVVHTAQAISKLMAPPQQFVKSVPSLVDLSEEGISKALAQDPGASIFDIAKSKIKGWNEKTQDILNAADYKATKAAQMAAYEKSLTPIDWQTVEPHSSVKDNVLPPKVSDFPNISDTLELEKQGYNTNFFLYKGGRSNRETLPDPAKKNYERGLFYADSPSVAERYAKADVAKYVARAPKAFSADWKKATGTSYYDEAHMTPLIEAARNKGADLLMLKHLSDMGGMQNQYVVINPSIVRSPKAKFDPAKLDLNNLLAGLAGFGVAAPAVAGGMKSE